MTSTDASFFFPDNTVLNNFAIIRSMDLLGDLIGTRGRWCATVKNECAKGSTRPGREEMTKAPTIFGRALFPTRVDLIDIQQLRADMAAPGDGPEKHLGEAETIVIMRSHGFYNSFFVTDDSGAQRAAKQEGIRVVTTWDILRLLVRGRRLSLEDFHSHVATLVSHQRGAPPGWPDRSGIESWLGVR